MIQSRCQLVEPDLPLARYRIMFEAEEPVVLPRCQGSLWRSVLGRELHALSAGTVPIDMGRCPIPRGELYRYFFETRPPTNASKMRRYSNAPHPFVIAASCSGMLEEVAPGDLFGLELTLIGRANGALPAFITAFSRAGDAGLNENGGRAKLTGFDTVACGVSSESQLVVQYGSRFDPEATSPAVPPTAQRVMISLKSPLQLLMQKEGGRDSLSQRANHTQRVVVRPRDFRPHQLLSSLVRRISMLMTFHTNADLAVAIFVELKAAGQRVRMVEPRLDFETAVRWSARQKSRIKLDGLVGEFVLDLEKSSPLWPYLWLGQWVHAGKHTTEGLGRYVVQPI